MISENPCKNSPADFVFVIDSSRSIRPDDYEKVKIFVHNLLQFLEIGPNATRVGLLQYGSVVQNEFSLNKYSTKAEVEQAVKNMQHLATGTMTGLAIQYTAETAFTEAEGARDAQLQVPRIAMIVTDGRPQDSVEEVATQARQAGIQIFAIGVGRVDPNTLKAMGSEPHSEHVHLVANFSQMESLLSVFRSKLCTGVAACDSVDHQCQHVCVSTPASYRCKCRRGFILNPDNKTCTEIDSCNSVEHSCEHDCVGTPESYKCLCKNGYVLNPDGKTCSEIDHCADGQHGCEQEFVNTPDSCMCKCRDGYRLAPDGKTCHSVDLCQTVDHCCEHQCVSSTDSYMCRCKEGFMLLDDGRSCKTECNEGIIDLVFAIDGSKSLGNDNFELVKQFINAIVDSLDISEKGTHVGLIQYSTKVRTEFTLGQYSAPRDIKEAVSRMRYMARGSMTGSALRHMFEESFSAKEGARPNIPRVSIVFTDGRSKNDVSEWSNKLKNSGVTIYALGVGKAVEQELREIASAPFDKYVYYTEDFGKMEEVTKKLKSKICNDKPAHVSEHTCQCEDLIIFQKQVNEKLRSLLHNIEALSTRLQLLEKQLVKI
nr:matrilin-2-like [Nerophis lumbriciformis]